MAATGMVRSMNDGEHGSENYWAIGAPLRWRRYRCGACAYQYETLAISGSRAPDQCGLCGRPWIAVSETVGDRQRVPDVREL